MKFDTLVKVMTTNDDGYPMDVVGYFRTVSNAKIHANGRGAWGGMGHLETIHVVEKDGKLYELASTTPIKVDVDLIDEAKDAKARALAKLTPEDKAALGIVD